MESTEFVPVQSLDIETETQIDFNLYVNLPLNNKYILYRRAGGHLESDKLEKLTGNNVSNFFIEKKDYPVFIRYVAMRMSSLIGDGESSEGKKRMEAAAKAMLSSTLSQNDPSIAQALMTNLNDITGAIIETALENTSSTSRKLFRRLAQLAENGSSFQKHPINVASFAVLITFGIGYSGEQTISDMAMAAVLHDVGLSKVPPRIIPYAHDILKLSIEEREWIYKHPQLAIEIIEEKRIPLTSVAKTIILQHHEEFKGTGYPKGLRGYTITELAQILRVSDELDHLFCNMSSHSGHLKIQVSELLKRMGILKIVEPLLLARMTQILV